MGATVGAGRRGRDWQGDLRPQQYRVRKHRPEEPVVDRLLGGRAVNGSACYERRAAMPEGAFESALPRAPMQPILHAITRTLARLPHAQQRL
jgi:hypothetical protein